MSTPRPIHAIRAVLCSECWATITCRNWTKTSYRACCLCRKLYSNFLYRISYNISNNYCCPHSLIGTL